MSRRLRLSSEHLTDLTPEEFTTLAGGAGAEVTPLCTPPWFHEMRHVLTRAVDDAVSRAACSLTCWC